VCSPQQCWHTALLVRRPSSAASSPQPLPAAPNCPSAFALPRPQQLQLLRSTAHLIMPVPCTMHMHTIDPMMLAAEAAHTAARAARKLARTLHLVQHIKHTCHSPLRITLPSNDLGGSRESNTANSTFVHACINCCQPCYIIRQAFCQAVQQSAACEAQLLATCTCLPAAAA
jgi:hypothetical protein